MRIANLAGRLVLLATDDTAIDVETASAGRFGAAPQEVYERWDEFREWATTVSLASADARPFDRQDLGSPAPAPRQLLAIGLNYRAHVAESRFESLPPAPSVFTKFVSSLTGPYTTVTLPEGTVDWEVELVVVLGRAAYQVAEADAWSHVAGLSIGQDLSERTIQLAGPAPQFSLGKSFPGFAPVGPWLVTPDELPDPTSLGLGCRVNDEVVQDGNTRDLIFDVAQIISSVSGVMPLSPGDLIFTGTPSGVGMGRTPPRFLAPGDVLVSWIEGIGEIRQDLVAG